MHAWVGLSGPDSAFHARLAMFATDLDFAATKSTEAKPRIGKANSKSQPTREMHNFLTHSRSTKYLSFLKRMWQ